MYNVQPYVRSYTWQNCFDFSTKSIVEFDCTLLQNLSSLREICYISSPDKCTQILKDHCCQRTKIDTCVTSNKFYKRQRSTINAKMEAYGLYFKEHDYPDEQLYMRPW